MSLISRLIFFVKSLPFRLNPSIRFCRSLLVRRPVIFNIDRNSTLRGDLYCDEASLVIMGKVNMPKDTQVFSSSGGTVHIMEGVNLGKLSTLSAADHSEIVIGEGTSFYSSVLLSGSVTIGNGCLFGPNVTVMSGGHIINDRRPIRLQDAEYIKEHGRPSDNPVKIGDDCWLGVNVVILPGVELGKGCVVGAGAIVTKSFDDYSVVGGVPARLLKMRE